MATAGQPPPSCKVVLAANIAKSLLSEVSAGISQLGSIPHLVGFLANDDPAARLYADWTSKTCKENGIHFTLQTTTPPLLEEAIISANTDSSIHGIIIYYPVFSSSQDQYLQQIVSLSKDVEGLSHTYIFNLYQNVRFLDPDAQLQKSVLPCTPLAVIKILEYLHIYNTILPYGNRLFGRTVTVINRSEVVGRPLAAMMANDGAEVFSVDITGVQKFTRGEGRRSKRAEVVEMGEDFTLKDALGRSSVVISGVPGEKFKVKTEEVKEGAVCVNFSTEKNFEPSIKERASIYVPAIGKVTIAVLMRNLLRIMQNQKMAEQQPKG